MPKLAICGGTPLRTAKYPGWTVYTQRDRDMLSMAFGETDRSSRGRFNREFREKFAAYSGVKHCFTVANGTVSIEMILRALGIGYGDEVIVTPYTFIASVSSLIYAGVRPVFADVDPDTYQLSPEAAEKAITPKTKAIMPVYVGGCPDRLDAFAEICSRHGLALIGDAAQAVGARYGGKGVASYAAATSISCQNSKNLNSGEGGIILTDDDALADRLSATANLGADPSGRRSFVGLDNGMSEFQAAILLSQLEALDSQIRTRSANGAYLDKKLSELGFIKTLRRDPRLDVNAFHLYMFGLREEMLDGVGLEEFLEAVRAEGAPVTSGYKPVCAFPCMSGAYVTKCVGAGLDLHPDIPSAERISAHEACWIYQSRLLGTEKDMDDITNALVKVYENLDELKERRNAR